MCDELHAGFLFPELVKNFQWTLDALVLRIILRSGRLQSKPGLTPTEPEKPTTGAEWPANRALTLAALSSASAFCCVSVSISVRTN